MTAMAPLRFKKCTSGMASITSVERCSVLVCSTPNTHRQSGHAGTPAVCQFLPCAEGVWKLCEPRRDKLWHRHATMQGYRSCQLASNLGSWVTATGGSVLISQVHKAAFPCQPREQSETLPLCR